MSARQRQCRCACLKRVAYESPLCVQAIEFKDFSQAGLNAESMPERFAVDVALLVVMALYIVITCIDIYRAVQVRGLCIGAINAASN